MFDDHLIHTCVIENPAVGSTNAYSNKVKAYAAPLEGVRCRLIEDREMARQIVLSNEVSEAAIKSTYKLLVRADVDLQEKAKISSVTLDDGTVVSDVFVVSELYVRRGRNSHHKTAMLERIS